jgi:ribosomal RNA-processing protein 36
MSNKQEEKKSKSEKTKPLEFSCRAPVAPPKPQRQGLLKRVEETEDPRFNRKVGGEYNPEMFGKAYSFLDDYRLAEKRDISDKLRQKGGLSEERKAELSRDLARMESQDVARSKLSMEKAVRNELKQKELEMVSKTGKRAYYHPKSVVRKIIQEKKENDLRAKGQYDKFKAKQDKRKASLDRKNFSIPRTRRIIDA